MTEEEYMAKWHPGGTEYFTLNKEAAVTDPRIIHEDAVRERAQAQVRAGEELSDDISHANRRYLEKLGDSERTYKLRIQDHPLGES